MLFIAHTMVPSMLVYPSLALGIQLLPPVLRDSTFQSGFASNTVPDDFDLWPRSVWITRALASTRDKNGSTLIPPSGRDFAQTFVEDLESITGSGWALQTLDDSMDTPVQGIVLDLHDAESRDALNLTYESGVSTEEGYTLDINDGRAIIKGTGARGAWWGTRTLLQ
ncbi:hypothetical protein Micbo1qcDRAFT_168580, partial [Microdochium bolleyi]